MKEKTVPGCNFIVMQTFKPIGLIVAEKSVPKPNKNLAVANRSRVSCAYNMPRHL